MRLALQFGVCLAGLLLWTGAPCAHQEQQQPHSMTLITYNGRPAINVEEVRNKGIAVHSLNLDGLINVAAHLLREVPRDPEHVDEAAALIQRRVAELDPNDLASVFRAQIYARRWGVKRVPALVINGGEEVLYGVTDFARALEIWQEERSK